MLMMSAILNVTLTPSFIAISTRLNISVIMMMMCPSNPDISPCSNLNLDNSLSIKMGNTEKHTGNS